MIYGLSGVSGSGKSTLAHQAAQSLDLTLVETSITGMGRKAGFDVVAPMGLRDRIALQKSLFAQFEALLRDLKGPAILDRTPLDLVIYLLAEFHMHSGEELTKADLFWAADYVRACQALTEIYFDHVFVTTPLPIYRVDKEGGVRPPMNPAYQMHGHLILIGTLFDLKGNLEFTILDSADQGDRLEALADTIGHRLHFIHEQRHTARHVH